MPRPSRADSQRSPRLLERTRRRDGFTLAEVLAAVAVIAMLSLIAVPRAAKFIRRTRDMSTLGTITRELNKARLMAIQRGFNVGVLVKADGPDRIHLLVWEDRNPDYVPKDWTDTQGATHKEAVLGPGTKPVEVTDPSDPNAFSWIPAGVDVRLQSVRFNTYPAPGNSVAATIVFTPTGGVVPPTNADSGLPTITDGRGIYFTDSAGENSFRVTVPSNLTGKPRAEMFIVSSGEGDRPTGYYATDWRWR